MEMAAGKLVQAPYVVVRLWPKVHYCQGGVEVNVKAEVIDSSTGAAIPGRRVAWQEVRHEGWQQKT
jgi:hypothetical protein